MKKALLIGLIASATVLTGCNAIQDQAASMVLGQQFIDANDGLDRCDFSGMEYLKNTASDNHNKMMQGAALLALGSNYAAAHNMQAVDTIAQKLAGLSTSTTFAKERQHLIDAGVKTGNARVSNGFTRTCK